MTQTLNINDKMIKKQARKVLKRYRKWERLAGKSVFDIKSSQFRELPRKTDFFTKNDKNLVEYISAKDERDAILDALIKLSKRSREILFFSYCDQEYHTSYDIGQIIGYSDKSMDRLKSIALIEFAEAYQNGILLTFNQNNSHN